MADMTFTSKAFGAFLHHIKARPGARVLDMGPVCGENINLLAQRVHRLYICDMFTRLDQKRRKDQPSGRVWQHLDYAPNTFDGILIWGLPDRLADDAVREAGRRCQRMLKPGGIVMACALGEKEKNSRVQTFVLSNDFSITFRVQPHLNLPLHSRKTREIIDTLAPLKLAQSFLFRNGLREFLFKKE